MRKAGTPAAAASIQPGKIVDKGTITVPQEPSVDGEPESSHTHPLTAGLPELPSPERSSDSESPPESLHDGRTSEQGGDSGVSPQGTTRYPTPEPEIANSLGKRLIVCPRLDFGEGDPPPLLDDLFERVAQLEPITFPTEDEARNYSQANASEYLEPVPASSLVERIGKGKDLYIGPRIRSYTGLPAGDVLAAKIRIATDLDPLVQCVLLNDWGFGEIVLEAQEKLAHQRVGRYSEDVLREMREVVYDLEDCLYRKHHQRLTRQALADFFSSFQVQKHIKLHAIKMLRYYGAKHDGVRSVQGALTHMRTLLGLYIKEQLQEATPLYARRDSPEVVMDNARHAKGWTWKELSDQSIYRRRDKQVHVSKNTLMRIRKGERVHPDEISAVAEALDVAYQDLLPLDQ